MIHFSCSRCGQKFKVKPDFAGRSTKCPACKQALVVPQPDMTAAYVPNDKIEGLQSSVARAGIDADVTLGGDGAAAGPVRSGQKSVKELLVQRGKSGERYLVESEIARGGMGAVLRAVDCDIRREVAVKYLLKQADARNKARFVEEAQITGQLEHPNIPPVHELGVDSQKRVFFAMKMVRGRSLAQVLDELRKNPKSSEWPLSRLLTVFVNICNGLAYAHARGVIHRDLKPANIMVGDFGEVYVMDWGLAKVLDGQQRSAAAVAGPAPSAIPLSGSSPGKVATSREDADLTQEGAVLGTPAYMPPEQAMGKIDAIDQRSDIYSLGAILYEILTLQAPVNKEDGYLAVLMRVSEGQIEVPEKRNPKRGIPRELSAIAMKALAKEPGKRYQTVEALRKDIERFQEGRSVSAKDDTKWEMLWKFAKRNKGFSAGAVMTVAVLFFSLFFIGKAYLATNSAYAAFQKEQDEKDRRTKKAVPAFVEAARLAVDRRRFDNALTQVNVALEYDAANTEARLLKGQVLIVQKDFAGAANEIERYLEKEPSNAEAKRLVELCKRKNPDDPGNLLAFAHVFEQQNLPSFAEGLLTKHGRTSFEARKELLKLHQQRIEKAWPGLGGKLTMDDQGIYKLDFGECKQVTSLDPLEGMPLTWLSLAQCGQVRDLSPLQGMQLTLLNLVGCGQVRDLSPLQGMPLTLLNLHGCGHVRDLSPLQGMPLTWLSLINCGHVRDLSPLQGMPLTSLMLSGCGQVRDLSPLQGMPLNSLSLDNCVQVRDLSPLQGMPLTSLMLSNCGQVCDLSPLHRMPLASLGLFGCGQVRDLSPLDGMKLSEIRLPLNVDTGMAALRRMKTFDKINRMPAADFWKQYDAGKFPQYKP